MAGPRKYKISQIHDEGSCHPLTWHWPAGEAVSSRGENLKNSVAVPTVAILACIAALGLAAPAQADENLYLEQMRQPNRVFIDVSNGQLLRLGYVACDVMQSKLNSGLPISSARSYSDKAVAQTAYSMGLESDRATNMFITEVAEDYLC